MTTTNMMMAAMDPMDAANRAIIDARNAAKEAAAKKFARVFELEAQAAELKRQALADIKAGINVNPASQASTHAKVVLGAALMGLAKNSYAAEGTLAYQVREYLAGTLSRNQERQLFDLPLLDEDKIKSVRSNRKTNFSAFLDEAKEQGLKMFSGKKSQQARSAQPKKNAASPKRQIEEAEVNTEIQPSLFDDVDS